MNKNFIIKTIFIILAVSLLMLAVVYKQSTDNVAKLENEISSRVSGIELIWDTDNREIDLKTLWYYLKFLDNSEIQNYTLENAKKEIVFQNGIKTSVNLFTKQNTIELKNKGEFVATLNYEIDTLKAATNTFWANIFYILLIGLLTFSISIIVYLLEYFEHEKTKIQLDQSRKLAAIGQTAAMLAHDVRKPFASVKALLANLNFFAKNPDKLELAQKDLGKTISGVENMIADIMDFSRENKYDLKPTAIEPLIESSVGAFKSAIDSSKFNIEVKTKFAHTNQPLLEEQKMLRVFQNILQNAFEAITIMGNKTSGEILISTREDPEGRFIISIANDGPKFSKEAEENIFESFFTSGKNSGTGLGLASVKKIIELHNGTITARNRENEEGVEFVIELHSQKL